MTLGIFIYLFVLFFYWWNLKPSMKKHTTLVFKEPLSHIFHQEVTMDLSGFYSKLSLHPEKLVRFRN